MAYAFMKRRIPVVKVVERKEAALRDRRSGSPQAANAAASSACRLSGQTLQVVRQRLETASVEFIDENGGGVSVRFWEPSGECDESILRFGIQGRANAHPCLVRWMLQSLREVKCRSRTVL